MTYSKALRYTASSCTDLDSARFWIGSKKPWDARFWIIFTLAARFCTILHVLHDFTQFCTILHDFAQFCTILNKISFSQIGYQFFSAFKNELKSQHRLLHLRYHNEMKSFLKKHSYFIQLHFLKISMIRHRAVHKMLKNLRKYMCIKIRALYQLFHSLYLDVSL